MAGKIIADQIQSTTAGTIDSKHLVKSIPKVHCKSNVLAVGNTASEDSFLVSSITDEGLGDADINFTNAFANNGYTAIGTASGIFVGTSFNTHFGGVTTSKDDVRMYRSGENAYKDAPFAYIAIGELA
jgi:hypothetical protein